MSSSPGIVTTVIIIITILVIMAVIGFRRRAEALRNNVHHPQFLTLTMDKFLNDMEKEKPIRFTSQQLRIATDNFTNLQGSGGFGAVYKGVFNNETIVAVKVLYGSSDKKIEQQFMAEVSTIGRVHHFNLVRLYGFCFDWNLRALVYEYMTNGSLDKFLFSEEKILGFQKLHEIAIGTAKGITYLHEECQQRIIHYDIKPGNILLDAQFFPKVADFGLAKLCNRENTPITMTGGRGTPGYAAPELWMPYPITHKCDVYSFGMLLFEIIGRRRNLDIQLPESQEWFPRWVWENIENGDLGELMKVCEIDDINRETTERMVKTALWCVQYRPEQRPLMSMVVKMLEGAMEIPAPSNPFAHLRVEAQIPSIPALTTCTETPVDSESSSVITESTLVRTTPTMKKYEIEVAGSST
ncbi:Kinase [Theobroma cacao]|uniref:Kinase n=1 Tax=Theobroma cacao TaxID=3641 RepID=A0A061GQQ7_THECC|nr:Kinase [Theobroma cacao]